MSFPEGGMLTNYLDPYHLTYLLKKTFRPQTSSQKTFTRFPRLKKVLAYCDNVWECEQIYQRGSMVFIYIAWLLELLQQLMLKLNKNKKIGCAWAQLFIELLMKGLFELMRYDFRLKLSALSYNNIIVFIKGNGRKD